MKLLHLDSSALGTGSVTRELTAAIVARWQDKLPQLQVEYRDLDRDPLPHLTGQSLAQANPEEAADAARTMEQFLAADVLVIGAPMYNFSIPSTLKAWIDRVAVAGKTFRYGAQGPEGLAGGKKIIIASGRGGIHSGAPSDFQETYLRQVFGFLGVTDIEFVRAEGVAYSPQHRSDAIAGALASIPEPVRLAA
ncbi:FMN-dependent NADH-azoreductase [Pseudoxanthomonas sacheonensis]|uniref:FMN dependent NADH:quinone oxidoreductase n=1 Tax=Pseudoxanthomonas sacheonensis TaxID=443615 RepID=A0ABU1RPB1_9GAMM|nr:NAD(P)H-dependent oxidoreductase [Pseudoxanthomonas sacheonensis]MDR6840611.1 FMN-dependent NADH-azoreductase [Pseudoxanthomonas sacheonensis]